MCSGSSVGFSDLWLTIILFFCRFKQGCVLLLVNSTLQRGELPSMFDEFMFFLFFCFFEIV